ncbi:MAG: hypothetical protein GX495_01620 [Chloroflexi bacterium]|nr:hypothetical protein [Chloroflexota bacterium]
MEHRYEPSFPLSLTRAELESFNNFWKSLSAEDQAVFDDLIQAALQRRASQSSQSAYLPYHIFLLSLLVEEHKEVKRLRQHEQTRHRRSGPRPPTPGTDHG